MTASGASRNSAAPIAMTHANAIASRAVIATPPRVRAGRSAPR
jgi:hypothetical protein